MVQGCLAKKPNLERSLDLRIIPHPFPTHFEDAAGDGVGILGYAFEDEKEDIPVLLKERELDGRRRGLR
jgi:hypothetical protein